VLVLLEGGGGDGVEVKTVKVGLVEVKMEVRVEVMAVM